MWVQKTCEKGYVWNPAACNCENGKCLVSIMDDLPIIYDEITYTEEKNLMKKI